MRSHERSQMWDRSGIATVRLRPILLSSNWSGNSCGSLRAVTTRLVNFSYSLSLSSSFSLSPSIPPLSLCVRARLPSKSIYTRETRWSLILFITSFTRKVKRKREEKRNREMVCFRISQVSLTLTKAISGSIPNKFVERTSESSLDKISHDVECYSRRKASAVIVEITFRTKLYWKKCAYIRSVTRKTRRVVTGERHAYTNGRMLLQNDRNTQRSVK